VKKFAAIFLIALTAVMFAGCAPKTTTKKVEIWWSIYLITQYTLSSETVAAGAVDGFNAAMQTKTAGVVDDKGNPKISYELSQSGTTLQLVMVYKDYDALRKFYGLDASTGYVDYTTKETTFLIEYSHTHQNPWQTLVSATIDRTTEINNEILMFFTLSPSNQTGYYYLLRAGTRQTSVTGAYKSVDNITSYDYYFNSDVDQITVYNRRPNTPMWYVVGACATVIFMLGAYFVFKSVYNRRKVRYTNIQNGGATT